MFIANSQMLVESVAAIVGNEVIYLSDLENTIADVRRNGIKLLLMNLHAKYFSRCLFPSFYGSGQDR